jgi:hypothetical protein
MRKMPGRARWIPTGHARSDLHDGVQLRGGVGRRVRPAGGRRERKPVEEAARRDPGGGGVGRAIFPGEGGKVVGGGVVTPLDGLPVEGPASFG